MTPDFLYSADLSTAGLHGGALRRAWQHGDVHRIGRGVYLATEEWEALDPRAKYRAVIEAMVPRLRRSLILSHQSAAALWGFPVLDEWPSRVHFFDPSRPTGKRTPNVVLHPGDPGADSALVDGLLCTSAGRTAVDVALAEGFLPGLLGFEYGLAQGLFDKSELEGLLEARPHSRNRRASRVALDIAGDQSESAGESISKGMLHQLGFPRPEQQKRFVCNGRTYYVDFWWEKYAIAGDFDGEQKYLDPALRGGRTVEQVVLGERERDSAIRSRPDVANLVRWKYVTARDPARLAQVVADAGLPRKEVFRRG